MRWGAKTLARHFRLPCAVSTGLNVVFLSTRCSLRGHPILGEREEINYETEGTMKATVAIGLPKRIHNQETYPQNGSLEVLRVLSLPLPSLTSSFSNPACGLAPSPSPKTVSPLR